MNKIIKLPCYDIKIKCDEEDKPYKISSSIKEYFEVRKGSEDASTLVMSCAADVIEGIILAHAVAGIDIKNKKYVAGIEHYITVLTRQCFMIDKEELFA